MSGGKITSNKGDIGSVVGYANSGIINISRCYWSSGVGGYNATGDGSPTIDSEASLVSLNTKSMDNLNNYNSSWSKWFMLHLNGGNINSLNQTSLAVTQKHFPDHVKEGNTFLFWCLDTECNERHDPNTTNIIADNHTLYAAWTINNYTITFDYGNGTVVNQVLKYNETINYPVNLTREGYTYNGWNPRPENTCK